MILSFLLRIIFKITDAYVATMLGIAEMLRFGVVSFSDMYYQSDARAKAIIESGVKANLGLNCLF